MEDLWFHVALDYNTVRSNWKLLVFCATESDTVRMSQYLEWKAKYADHTLKYGMPNDNVFYIFCAGGDTYASNPNLTKFGIDVKLVILPEPKIMITAREITLRNRDDLIIASVVVASLLWGLGAFN